MVSLGVRWQAFHWPHLVGFAVLIFGTCAYNGVIPPPRCWPRRAAPPPSHDEEAIQVANNDATETDRLE